MFKRKFLLYILSSLIFVLVVRAAPPAAITDLKPTLILISLDGYRYDYIDIYHPQNLSRLAEQGVRAKWMTPIFPSKTFPNHYTIATGLYAEHHGIIGNKMYDPQFKAFFTLGDRAEVQKPRWWLGEPIWVTAQKHGLKTAAYFYPGTEAEIDGMRPTFWMAYNDSTPNSKRVDQTLAWLDLPVEQRPQFYALYFSDLDDAGHDYSPDSPEIAQAVAHVDSAIGGLLDGLQSRGIDKQVNLIIVSDHGMATVQPGNVVLLDNYFDRDQADVIIWDHQVTGIFPKDGKTNSIYNALITRLPGHITCYKKADIPDRYHFKHNRRIAPIICVAEEGWMMMECSRYEEAVKENKIPDHPTGAHGYDNRLQSMQAIFVAYGPAFKQHSVIEPFVNVDVYNIMTKILDLTPAKNDGGVDTAAEVLK